MSTVQADGFVALVPARMASTRLPRKPLADLLGVPMVVRAARQALASGARRVVVAADDAAICQACSEHGIEALLTRVDHPSGSDRLAEAATALALSDDEIVVNVQGDEPLIDPALVAAVAWRLQTDTACPMATAAHPIGDVAELCNPNVVKVVLDAAQRALLFTRAPAPWWRDGWAGGIQRLSDPAPLRHVGLYAYRAGFLRRFPALAPAPMEQLESLEQLRVLWHGHRIAVHLTAHAPAAGVDTPEDLARVRALLQAMR